VLEIESSSDKAAWNKFDEKDRLNNGTGNREIRDQTTYFLLSKGQIILRANEKAAFAEITCHLLAKGCPFLL